MAKASRIYVEGKHDAEIVEKIWGDDLRDVGVVVEFLNGIDDLPAIAAEFAAAGGRRLGVLVDHLVEGSKESRIAAQVTSADVLVVGHPYVDVWAAVKPAVVGITSWPKVPRGVRGRRGCSQPSAGRRIPLPPGGASSAGCTPTRTWSRPFLGRVEELIDFVTAPGIH